MNKDQAINNSLWNVVEGQMIIFLKMDPKYSKKKKIMQPYKYKYKYTWLVFSSFIHGV